MELAATRRWLEILASDEVLERWQRREYALRVMNNITEARRLLTAVQGFRE